MNNKIFTLAFFAFISFLMLIISGCQDDSGDICSGVICPTGQQCIDGNCAIIEPCGGCPAGQVCLNGACEPIESCLGVQCPSGQECINGTCVTIAPITKAGVLTNDETWTSDRIYFLANKVVVSAGVTLTIEPGTIIKGNPGVGTLATSLIVAQGGKIIADGTVDKPIIFTSSLDNIQVGQKTGTNLTATDNSKWGGVIILGKAKISAGNGDTEAQIEGIPANELYGRYGGSDDGDNSGVLRYVSIRHGGAEIGAGNEINGLTLGGVGNGTIIDHIEVVGNLDDGVECFGGSVNLTNVAVIYQGDDAIDLDMNYAGTIDNFVVIMGGGIGDEALEIDGPEGSTHTDGIFTLKNGTIKSEDGEGSGADLKSKAQGNLFDCSFEGFKVGKMIKIRESFDIDNGCADKTDAVDHYIGSTPTLILRNCEFESNAAETIDITNGYVNADNTASCGDMLPAPVEQAIDLATMNGGSKVVGTGQTTKGADMTPFKVWTWASLNGKL